MHFRRFLRHKAAAAAAHANTLRKGGQGNLKHHHTCAAAAATRCSSRATAAPAWHSTPRHTRRRPARVPPPHPKLKKHFHTNITQTNQQQQQQHQNNYHDHKHHTRNNNRTHRGGGKTWKRAAGAAAVVSALTASLLNLQQPFQHRTHKAVHAQAAAQQQQEWPIFTADQIAEHDSLENGVWVTVGDAVYDLTSFLEQHPGGGDKLLMAAGGPVEPYWRLYSIHTQHKAQRDFIASIIKPLRIGTLAPQDAASQEHQDAVKGAASEADPYALEPQNRHPALLVHGQKPFNAESPAMLLADQMITPNELFYVRHHHPVPDIDPNTYTLVVENQCDGKTHSFSLDELKTKFQRHQVTATLQCAGNRRKELTDIEPTSGLPWRVGAVSTATFAGVRLKDVLEHVGVDERSAIMCDQHEDTGKADDVVRHVQFRGADPPFDGSIPIDRAVDARADVLLAYEMNGEPMPRDHGFPIRAIVPGVVGARNVKWVTRVVASGEEAHSVWQRGAPYKGFGPSVRAKQAGTPQQVQRMYSVQELPIQSAICEPRDGSTVATTSDLNMRGYAWSGGGRRIARVDVSVDGGKTWHNAKLGKGSEQPRGRAWAWTLWSFTMPANAVAQAVAAGSDSKGGTATELMVKAVDESHNCQPEHATAVWNFRGILNNSWHRVRVHLKDD